MALDIQFNILFLLSLDNLLEDILSARILSSDLTKSIFFAGVPSDIEL